MREHKYVLHDLFYKGSCQSGRLQDCAEPFDDISVEQQDKNERWPLEYATVPSWRSTEARLERLHEYNRKLGLQRTGVCMRLCYCMYSPFREYAYTVWNFSSTKGCQVSCPAVWSSAEIHRTKCWSWENRLAWRLWVTFEFCHLRWFTLTVHHTCTLCHLPHRQETISWRIARSWRKFQLLLWLFWCL